MILPAADLADALRAVPLFANLPPNQVGWLIGHGDVISVPAGAAIFGEGDPGNAFYVVLDGEVRITKRIGGEETTLATHRAGAFTGEVPLLADTPSIANARAMRPTRLYRLDRATFLEMFSACPPVTATVLGAMAQRIRGVESALQGREKLAALGKLAAGLAHELNNPAAAARRAAADLRPTIERTQTLALRLSAHGLDEAKLDTLAAIANEAATSAAPTLSPLALCDREDALCGWLDDRDVPEGWKLAATFAGEGLEPARLDAIAALVPPAALPDALAWLEATLTVAGLVETVEHGADRIADLVGAVKRYSYMDQAPQQEVDIHDGLESTLTMLAHELKGGIDILRDYDPALPRIHAFGGELNQVWTNLIDNAIDAMAGTGQLRIRTAHEQDRVLVEIADTGAGIPPEVLPRIFEPFFTTKGVGEGTGLGLDVVHRIVVGHHHGDIQVESPPGSTCFRISLPIAPPEQNEPRSS